MRFAVMRALFIFINWGNFVENINGDDLNRDGC